jgi:hypothetical protein
MHHIKRSTLGGAALVGLVSCLVTAAPALADAQLHVGVTGVQFTSLTCLNASCSLVQITLAGNATSNLATGTGSFQAILTVDNSLPGSCNIVNETSAFVFNTGTINVHSYHEDCATHGLRIDTTFQITGGTGVFQGATGSGREFNAVTPGSKNPVIYNGTISF